jgi:hypothetical protein
MLGMFAGGPFGGFRPGKSVAVQRFVFLHGGVETEDALIVAPHYDADQLKKPLLSKQHWWRGLDSNQRRHSQRVYSPSPLATRAPLRELPFIARKMHDCAQLATPRGYEHRTVRRATKSSHAEAVLYVCFGRSAMLLFLPGTVAEGYIKR